MSQRQEPGSGTTSTDRPDQVLLAAPFYPPHVGGIERYTANVAAELVRRGSSVTVLACTPDRTAPASRPGPAGEQVLELAAVVVAGRLPFPLPSRRNRRILRQLRDQRYRFLLVQSHLFVSGLLAAGLARDARRVWLNHGSGHVPGGSRLLDALIAGYEHLLAALLRRRVHAVAGVSAESAAWLSHLGVRDAVGAGNAVAAVAPPRGERVPGPLRVLYAGRLEPGKGADEAIDIVRRARRSGPVELTICGDGTQRPLVEAMLRDDPGVADYRGPVDHDELLRRMREADVFIYPSRYPEGFPTVLLEAGSQGCAVLTYPVAGTEELLVAGGGWRVADADAASAALAEAAADPIAAYERGEQLRRAVAEHFTWPRVVDRLLAL